jgi:RecA/RadA recombinase
MAKKTTTKANSYLKKFLKAADSEYATIAADGLVGGDITNWIGTGSLSLNALVGASIYSGIPGNKVIELCGDKATGKTFYLLAIIKAFQEQFPTGLVIFFETEGATTLKTLEDRGVDTSRIGWCPVGTVEEFRSQAMRIANDYQETPEDERPPMFFALDSLGMLSTLKETKDIAAGHDARDMTRAQGIKGTFRALTLKLAILGIPLVMTNHVSPVIGAYVPTKIGTGGSGREYAASATIMLTKKKGEIDGKKVGVIITAKLEKCRYTVEGRKVETLLRWDTGLDPYWGLLDFALKFGAATKEGHQIHFIDGGKATSRKEVEANPAKYFTKVVLDKIEEHVAGEFQFGTTSLFVDEEDAELKGADTFEKLKAKQKKGKKEDVAIQQEEESDGAGSSSSE